jgi:O-acetyl-ADP-ribose deacetylase (regulator of RNase III)
MIYYIEGDFFETPAQTLVNTVNTVGVMGKGIAKQFKEIYPEMFKRYRDFCENEQFEIGQLYLYKTPHKWILNFPTKTDWRLPSKIEYIEVGLKKLVANIERFGIHSIAFPALGCGNGELQWSQVRPLMEKYLKVLSIDVFIYPPKHYTWKPEHHNIEEIKKWLRSEPQSLAFSEVWKDIKSLLSNKKSFRTISKKTSFSVELCQNPEGINIINRNTFIDKETILNVWQQIRSYGFTARPLAPGGLNKNISYLQPILSELPYIKVVPLSSTFQGLNTNAAFGLQYIAPNQKNNNQDLFLNHPIHV